MRVRFIERGLQDEKTMLEAGSSAIPASSSSEDTRSELPRLQNMKSPSDAPTQDTGKLYWWSGACLVVYLKDINHIETFMNIRSLQPRFMFLSV